jgi:hypothetical protein
MSMSLEDGAIYSRSEAKIISVNDQTAHRVSLAGRTGRVRAGNQPGEAWGQRSKG